MPMGIRPKKATRESMKTWSVILASAIGPQPLSGTWSTSLHWTCLSTRLNLEVALVLTLTQVRKIQQGEWTPRQVVQLA